MLNKLIDILDMHKPSFSFFFFGFLTKISITITYSYLESRRELVCP